MSNRYMVSAEVVDTLIANGKATKLPPREVGFGVAIAGHQFDSMSGEVYTGPSNRVPRPELHEALEGLKFSVG